MRDCGCCSKCGGNSLLHSNSSQICFTSFSPRQSWVHYLWLHCWALIFGCDPCPGSAACLEGVRDVRSDSSAPAAPLPRSQPDPAGHPHPCLEQGMMNWCQRGRRAACSIPAICSTCAGSALGGAVSPSVLHLHWLHQSSDKERSPARALRSQLPGAHR